MSSSSQLFRPRDSRRAHKRYMVRRASRNAFVTDYDTGRERIIPYSVFERRYIPV